MVFGFSAVFEPSGPRESCGTWTFQYRTPRSRIVSSNPRSFSPSKKLFTQLFGEIPVAVFPEKRKIKINNKKHNFIAMGRFRAERTSRVVWNVDVSVSNAQFSFRLVQSSLVLSRKRLFYLTFQPIPSCSFSRPKGAPRALLGRALLGRALLRWL